MILSTPILFSEFKMERGTRLVTAVRWRGTSGSFEQGAHRHLLGGGHLPCPYPGHGWCRRHLRERRSGGMSEEQSSGCTCEWR